MPCWGSKTNSHWGTRSSYSASYRKVCKSHRSCRRGRPSRPSSDSTTCSRDAGRCRLDRSRSSWCTAFACRSCHSRTSPSTFLLCAPDSGTIYQRRNEQARRLVGLCAAARTRPAPIGMAGRPPVRPASRVSAQVDACVSWSRLCASRCRLRRIDLQALALSAKPFSLLELCRSAAAFSRRPGALLFVPPKPRVGPPISHCDQRPTLNKQK